MIRSFFKWIFPLAAIVALSTPNLAKADIIYGVTGISGTPSKLYSETYSITPSGSAFGLVGDVTLFGSGTPLSLSSLTYINGTLYGVTNSNSGTANGTSGEYTNSLITIDKTSGVATLVNEKLGLGTQQVQSLAYSSTNNILYGFSKGGVGASPHSNSLVTFNLATGLASEVGTGTTISGNTTGNGLAVDSTGNIYLAPFGISTGPNNRMYSVNPSTGVATSGLTFSNVPLSSSNMKAMAFDGSGNLYGLDFQPGTQTELVSITNTGSNWQLGDLGTTPDGTVPGSPFVGIAFAPAAVPEPSPFVLSGLMGLGLVLRHVYRKRVKPAHC